MNRHKTSLILFLPIFVVAGGIERTAVFASDKPVVVSTEPANGATDVSRDLKWVTVTFSKPMNIYYKGVTTQNWGGGQNYTWLADAKTFSFSRPNADTPLPPSPQSHSG